MPSDRANKLMIRQRVDEILQMRLAGAQFHDIRAHAEEQGWNVSERQLWRYIARGDELLEETMERDRDKLFREHIAQRRALRARCMAVSDYSNARLLLADEAKLLDLYPADRHELTGKDGGPLTAASVELSDDERDAAIKAIIGRTPALGAGNDRPAADREGDGAGSAVGASGKGDDLRWDEARSLAGDVTPLDI